MMNLIKYCKEEFNPLFGCKTIQIGTLEYYREIESNRNIHDPKEGILTFSVINYNSKEDVSNRKYFDFIGSNISLNGCYVEKIIPNCCVFCLSMNDILEGNQFDEAYNSSFKIKSLILFINTIVRVLKMNLTRDNFNEFDVQSIFSEDSFKKRLEILPFSNPVNYNSSKNQLIKNASEMSYKEIPNELQVLFTKDEKYKNDSEYRIAFVFRYRNRIISIKKDPIILNIEKYTDLFSN